MLESPEEFSCSKKTAVRTYAKIHCVSTKTFYSWAVFNYTVDSVKQLL